MSNLVCVDDFAREALSILPRNALDYYRSGADGEVTLSQNRDALRRYGKGSLYECFQKSRQ